MQKPHQSVRVNKLTRVMLHRIAPAMKIFGILGLLFAMLPCLYQCKLYIKMKLRVWRAYKCNSLVSAKPHRPERVNKLPRVLQSRILQAIEIFQISGLPIDMVPCLKQCNVYIVRKLRVWRAPKCNFLVSAKTAPTGTAQQTTPCLAAPSWARNRNFQNFGASFCHGSVFAPMQSLY